MADTTQNKDSEKVCKQCGALAEVGSIFCKKCGATLQTPVSLSPLGAKGVTGSPKSISPVKRMVLTVIKGIAGIAGVAFWLCPLRTSIQVLLFAVSIGVLLICHFALSSLDDTYLDKHVKDGYWPPKPINWDAPTSENAKDKNTAERNS